MHLIFCVDDDYGLSFCGRRLSRDREVYAHMLKISHGHTLWVAPESTGLFPDGTVSVDADFILNASSGDYCFSEVPIEMDSVNKLESVILYHWNRRYPSTEKLSPELLTGMRLIHTETFKGSSHEKITMERYTL